MAQIIDITSKLAERKAFNEMSMVEVAASIRKDIKAANKAGTIPKGYKVSVKTTHFVLSDREFIDVEITAIPTDTALCTISTGCKEPSYTLPVLSVISALDNIVAAYHRTSDAAKRRSFNPVKVEWKLQYDSKRLMGRAY